MPYTPPLKHAAFLKREIQILVFHFGKFTARNGNPFKARERDTVGRDILDKIHVDDKRAVRARELFLLANRLPKIVHAPVALQDCAAVQMEIQSASPYFAIFQVAEFYSRYAVLAIQKQRRIFIFHAFFQDRIHQREKAFFENRLHLIIKSVDRV